MSVYNASYTTSYKYNRENVYIWSNTSVVDAISNQAFVSNIDLSTDLQQKLDQVSNQAYITQATTNAYLLALASANGSNGVIDVSNVINARADGLSNDISTLRLVDASNIVALSNLSNQVQDMDGELSNVVSNELPWIHEKLNATSNETYFFFPVAYSNLEAKVLAVSNEAYDVSSNTVYNLFHLNSQAIATVSNQAYFLGPSNLAAFSNDVYNGLPTEGLSNNLNDKFDVLCNEVVFIRQTRTRLPNLVIYYDP